MQDAEFLSGFLAPTTAERQLLRAARNGEECMLSPGLPPEREETPPEPDEAPAAGGENNDDAAASTEAAQGDAPGSAAKPELEVESAGASLSDAAAALLAEAGFGAGFTETSRAEPGGEGEAESAPDPEDAITIRAEFLRALIASENGPKIHDSGLRLRGARVTGLLNLAGCRIRHILGFRCCRFEEPVVMTQAEARSVAFDGSVMPGFYGDRLETKGSLYLRGNDADGPFRATDSVSLVSARIGGDLRLRAGHFAYSGQLARRMTELTGARRERLDEYAAAVSLHKATVGGTLDLRETVLETGAVDLALASLHTLRVFQEDIDREFGPKELKRSRRVGDRLILDGFEYRHIPVGLAGDPGTLKRFLLMQIDEHLGVAQFNDYRDSHKALEAEAGLPKLREIFRVQNRLRPQPFERLARVLREMGYEEVAREIAVFKQRRRRLARGEFSGFGSAIHWLFGLSAGFGYRPLRAVGWLVAIWLIGAGLSFTAHRAGAIGPTVDAAQPAPEAVHRRFEALVYSADVLIPFVILHQEDAFAPDPEKTLGRALHYFGFLQVALGWILSALAIAGVTGLVQRS